MRQRERFKRKGQVILGERVQEVREQIVNNFLSEFMPHPIDNNFHTNVISYRSSQKAITSWCQNMYHLHCFSVGWLLTFWTGCFFIWRNYHIHGGIFLTIRLLIKCLQYPSVILTNKNVSSHFKCRLGECPCVWLQNSFLGHQTQCRAQEWYLVKESPDLYLLPISVL